ncbi:DUF4229 domain-containing protein [Nocardia sp. NEAU-351]|uniref:DUF4229 domain-containing protein n=1 Tax=Nocardia bovistercoris TaxID=2785916 RepID=A0A931IBK5_9NOCA|nr:DUF4229 domain-containing protein [Nocardia bovistercoris]
MDKTDRFSRSSAGRAGGLRRAAGVASPTLVGVSDVTRPDGASGWQTSNPANSQLSNPRRRLAVHLALYTLARLGLVAVLTVVVVVVANLLSVEIRMIVAILIAVVVAMPLSLLLFTKLRSKVNADIAVVDEKRRKDKAQLRARLRGEDGSASA